MQLKKRAFCVFGFRVWGWGDSDLSKGSLKVALKGFRDFRTCVLGRREAQ